MANLGPESKFPNGEHGARALGAADSTDIESWSAPAIAAKRPKTLDEMVPPGALAVSATTDEVVTGIVQHVDERTGRSIVQTDTYRDGTPIVNFAPVNPGNVIVPYDQ